MSRGLLEKRDKLIRSLTYDVNHIQQQIDKLYEPLRCWPYMEKEAVSKQAYTDFLLLIEETITKPCEAMLEKVRESQAMNDRIAEIIDRAYTRNRKGTNEDVV